MRVGRLRRLGQVSAAIALALTCVAGAAAAQEVPTTFSPKLVLSNYNRHPVGVMASVEGGAYAARANDASALWYNPAGQAASGDLVLSGSASAFEWSWNTRDGEGDWIDDGYFNSVRAAAGSTSSTFNSKEWYWGALLAAPRSWRQYTNAETTVDLTDGQRNLVQVNSSEIETYFIGLGLGWKPEKPWRIGASVGLLGTWFQSDQSVTARDQTAAGPAASIAVLRTSGVSYDLRVNVGLQADLGKGFTLGLAVRSPGLHIWDSADATFDLLHADAGGTSQVTFRDTAASTIYRYPLEGTFGLAYREESWDLEFDVTASDSIGEYTFLGSEQSIKATAGGGGAETRFNDVRISAESVVNFALGGRRRISERLNLHAGVYTDYSPAPEDGKVFDKIDLYGATVGVSIKVRPGSFWVIGLNYLHGSRDGLTTRDLATGAPIPTDVTISSLGAVLGTTMAF